MDDDATFQYADDNTPKATSVSSQLVTAGDLFALKGCSHRDYPGICWKNIRDYSWDKLLVRAGGSTCNADPEEIMQASLERCWQRRGAE